MLKLSGQNSLNELFLYLNYIKSLKNIDHSKTIKFYNFIKSDDFNLLFKKVKQHKNKWITHKINNESIFEFMLNKNSVTFKTIHWTKTVDFNN